MAGVVVLCSGGLDSAVLVYDERRLVGAEDVTALWVNYGQRTAYEEYRAAQKIAASAGVRFTPMDMAASKAVFGGSLLIGGPREALAGDGENAGTIVPNRNMILLALGGALAISVGATHLVYGAHEGGNESYPDTRPEFIEAMREALRRCDNAGPELVATFATFTKAVVVQYGKALGVPFEYTYSCYRENGPCNNCRACAKRRAAFTDAGVHDPGWKG